MAWFRVVEPLSLCLLDGLAVPTDRLHLDTSRASAAATADYRFAADAIRALDNGQRSPRKQLTALVKRLVASLKR
jgi:hypothetical protein